MERSTVQSCLAAPVLIWNTFEFLRRAEEGPGAARQRHLARIGTTRNHLVGLFKPRVRARTSLLVVGPDDYFPLGSR